MSYTYLKLFLRDAKGQDHEKIVDGSLVEGPHGIMSADDQHAQILMWIEERGNAQFATELSLMSWQVITEYDA